MTTITTTTTALPADSMSLEAEQSEAANAVLRALGKTTRLQWNTLDNRLHRNWYRDWTWQCPHTGNFLNLINGVAKLAR